MPFVVRVSLQFRAGFLNSSISRYQRETVIHGSTRTIVPDILSSPLVQLTLHNPQNIEDQCHPALFSASTIIVHCFVPWS